MGVKYGAYLILPLKYEEGELRLSNLEHDCHRFSVTTMDLSETVKSMLLNGQVDFAITFPPITGDDIESRVLIRDPIQIAIAGRHPLLKKMKIRLEDLKDYPMICLTRDNPFTRVCEQFLAKKNLSLQMEEVNYNELMQRVEAGRDAGKVLCFTARNQFSSWYGRGYRCLPVEDLNEALITSIAWRKDADFGYEYKGLIEKIEKGYDRVYYRNYRNLKPE